MKNPLTEIREAIERNIRDRMLGLVSEVLCFDRESMTPGDDPSLQVQRWIRVDPLGGPVNPYDTNLRWKFTRHFRLLFNNPVGDMDVEGLERVELAMHGIAASLDATSLKLDYVDAVRWMGGEWATFVPKKSSGEDFSEGQEMWVVLGKLEVDFRKLKTEVATWAPQ